LRCIGSDEVTRLEQSLINSGMPATIDIAGKDLYGWAVEMGALQCEELLRPTEAAKHHHGTDTLEQQQAGTTTEDYSMEASSEEQGEEQEQKKDELSSSFRVLDRPDHDETTKNRRKIAMAYVILQP
jgi:hypothetical protein